jgi:hypothetical protein
VTSLSLPAFVGGTMLGSVKPYLLDSYLGVFGKSLVDAASSGADAAGSGTSDAVLLVSPHLPSSRARWQRHLLQTATGGSIWYAAAATRVVLSTQSLSQ